MRNIAVPDGHGYAVENVEDFAAASAITVRNGVVVINGGSATALTLPAPIAGPMRSNGDDGKQLLIVSTTAFAHTVTTPAKYNTGSAGAGLATFAAAAANFLRLVAWNGVWIACGNTGVTLT